MNKKGEKTNAQSLNPAQMRAAEHESGPLLIIAGAGAGKTRVLTARIARLIEKGVESEKILAITFTNKAAREMKERVDALLTKAQIEKRTAGEAHTPTPYGEKRSPFVSTFHSFGVHILRKSGKKIGVSPRFLIYDRDDTRKALKEAIKKSSVTLEAWPVKKVLSIISSQKNEGVTHTEFERSTEKRADHALISRIWREYEEIKTRERALDFDDLLLLPLVLMREHPDTLSEWRKRFSHIHIDEFQDTNTVQYELAQLLAQEHGNICVVGDADQTIYTWRGARIQNILSFKEDFPGTEIITLEENYRSTQNILSAANDVISKNNLRLEKNLFTKNTEGEGLGYVCALDESFEARYVVLKAQELIESGINPNEIAVLYRTNFQSRVLEELSIACDVPYQIVGTRFFERKEVKDMIAYLRLSLNPESIADLSRIINVPKRGIGKVTLGKMVTNREGELSPAMQNRVNTFREMILDFSKKAETLSPKELITYILKATGLEDDLKSGGEDERERLENIKELATLALKYDHLDPPDGLHALIDDAALMSDQDALDAPQSKEEKHGIKLMTVHASKGLEFDYVFITGLEEGLFPQERDEGTLEEREEERRLFYVAITRARKKVFLSHAAERTIFGSRNITVPSRFLEDISSELFEDGEEEMGGYDSEGKIEYLNIDEL